MLDLLHLHHWLHDNLHKQPHLNIFVDQEQYSLLYLQTLLLYLQMRIHRNLLLIVFFYQHLRFHFLHILEMDNFLSVFERLYSTVYTWILFQILLF